jgi:hypothetical protein
VPRDKRGDLLRCKCDRYETEMKSYFLVPPQLGLSLRTFCCCCFYTNVELCFFMLLRICTCLCQSSNVLLLVCHGFKQLAFYKHVKTFPSVLVAY